MASQLKKIAKNPLLLFQTLGHRRFLDWMSDEQYLKILYRVRMGKALHLDEPKTFNEKLQWLKVHYRKPEFTQMVDKQAVKDYVARRIGEEYVIPTLGIWDSFDQIDFDALPEQFVLKSTHNSGDVVVCRDKRKLDLEKARLRFEKSMKSNHYYSAREWPYKDVKPRIIAEAYVQDGDNQCLPVYKFFCFGGEPKLIQVIQNDKQADETIDYYTPAWELLDIRQNYPNSGVQLPKPRHLEQMVALAGKLAEDLPFIRVDLYCADDRLYFSEYTFFSDSGMEPFHPETVDAQLGEWIDLRKCHRA